MKSTDKQKFLELLKNKGGLQAASKKGVGKSGSAEKQSRPTNLPAKPAERPRSKNF